MAVAAPEFSVLARDKAFEALYRRYVQDVYHYALALLRNPADAEDITQTTFMNAYRAYKRGDEIEKPQNWLIKIAHNAARTRYARTSRRVKEVPLEDHLDQLAVPEEERPNIEGVLRALGRLPFNQRAALVMRELEGRTYAEIADTLGVSVSAVETLIFRARRSLRLRASALRSLTAVPVPSSLAQFVGGGGVVAAGGGALVGTGLLVKIAVALIAGALATGISGDHTRQAAAAADSAPVALVPPWSGQGGGLVVFKSGVSTTSIVGGGGVTTEFSGGAAANEAKPDRVPVEVSISDIAEPGHDSQSSENAASSPVPPAVSTTTQQATSTATGIVSSVEETVSTTAATLSVPTPTVPTVPVTVPTPPPPPPLPAPPPLP
jgi:RNA polymerase sigma factor (sigma-70 family)